MQADNKLYAVGDSEFKVYHFDNTANSLLLGEVRELAEPRVAAYLPSLSYLSNKIIKTGGDGKRATEIYDVKDDLWVDGPDMNVARFSHG